MTRNQIEYQKLLETQRANRASESITTARDAATRALGLDTLQETQRHNQQVELQARDNLAEQYRDNVAQLQELQRSHMASEGIGWFNAQTQRNAQEETARYNTVLTALNQYRADIDKYRADVSQYAADVGASSHIASAGIAAAASQYASDNALLAKQLQLDLDKYGIDVRQDLERMQLAETSRANVARETETNRSNIANEAIRSGSLLQTTANNMVSRAQNQQKISADIRLRGEQNDIARFNAETQRKTAEANISLVPSQQFSNVTRSIQNLVSSGATIANFLKRK